MAKKSGRPAKGANPISSQQKIIDATVSLVKEQGADCVTVRNVCQKANLSIGTFYHYFRDKDDLMMYFLKETSFEDCELKTPLSAISGRISELYMRLIDRYAELGMDFMKSFYSTDNRSLSAYMGEVDGNFADGTVMARSEMEMQDALDAGYVKPDTDIHAVCVDICTIVKGCVFEWCLNDGAPDIASSLERILNNYLNNYLAKQNNG